MEKRFFAASNSRYGFVSYFGEIFGERSDKIYIIEGAPGSGKSRFMGDIAKQLDESADVTYYYCSSDPRSLDGITLKNRSSGVKISVIDGTSPHIFNMLLPGVRDEVLNFSEFWDSSKIAGNSSYIMSLNAEKSRAYTRAYKYLASAGELDDIASGLINTAVCHEKLDKYISKALSRAKKGNGAYERVVTHAVCSSGRIYFSTLEDMCERKMVIPDYYGVGSVFMSATAKKASDEGIYHVVSVDPVYPEKYREIFFPDLSLCFVLRSQNDGTVSDRPSENTQTASLYRFTDPEKFKDVRGEVRMARMLRDSSVESAVNALSSASKAHLKLESIYTPAMDFKALTEYRRKTAEKIEKELGV